MIVGITGASGFLGRRLRARLESQGHTIRPISTVTAPTRDAPGCDAIVNLAGEPIAQRWTPAVRERIKLSRAAGTRALLEAMRPSPPKILISGSAIGYYGSRGGELLDESSAPGDGFLAQVCHAWEREALAAQQFGTRVVLLRTGIALGPDGGALAKMLRPFRLGLGGPVAGGRHWMSWIHADDVIRLIEFALTSPHVTGPLNAVAPNPVTNAQFTRALAKTLHRPAIFPLPAFILRLMFGEMSQILMESQRVQAKAALAAGFEFRFPELSAALSDLFK